MPATYTDDDLLPLSALQHWLYCPRQCALIHLEQAWAENKFTAEGQTLHKKAHDGPDETKGGIRITRSLPVVSRTLGISGQCDIVEFHAVDGGNLRSEISDLREKTTESAREEPGNHFKAHVPNLKCTTQVVPVEYKRGKPKSHHADEVQLCAQAMCLEEMLGVSVPEGALYYGEKKRRTEVKFDATLRQLTADTAIALHEMIDSRITPLAEYNSRRCDACSLIEICQPKALRFKRGTAAWFSNNLK